MSASTTPGPRPVVSVVVIVVSRRSILTAPPDTESYSLSSNCRYCDALAVLLMFFSIQSADHPSLVRPHWRNAQRCRRSCEAVHWRHPNPTFRDGHHRECSSGLFSHLAASPLRLSQDLARWEPSSCMPKSLGAFPWDTKPRRKK